jgi:hypothetical protein
MTQATATRRVFSHKAPGCLTVQISILSQATLLAIPTGPDVVARFSRKGDQSSLIRGLVRGISVGGWARVGGSAVSVRAES